VRESEREREREREREILAALSATMKMVGQIYTKSNIGFM
jgi:hypothetical protein